MVVVTDNVESKVRRVVANIRNLPTPPIVFQQIQKVINDPNVSAGSIASILSEDPAMSIKVLKLTNSAFYGLAREVDSVKQAVLIVGLEAIKNLVLSASVLDMFKGKNIDQEFNDKFWRHSLATGVACRMLAKKIHSRGFLDADPAFSAGLLHDIGKLILVCFLPEEAAAYRTMREADKQSPDHVVEERAIGFTHAQIGGVLAETWKLPAKLAEAITFHHKPQMAQDENTIAYFVHLGNFLAKRTFLEQDEQYLVGVIEPGVLEFLGITEPDLDTYSEHLREEYLKAETFMKMVGL
jgi:putative nucleotidyltransferase with HDIG domain